MSCDYYYHDVFILYFQLDEESGAPKFSVNLVEVMDNIEQFVLQPASQGFLIKCRITRDRKGMDRGLYPTYYMHLERDDGRKVRIFSPFFTF